MTAVRIAHAEPRPGNLGNGVFITNGYLVVLADDAGHRAMPVWFRGHPGGGSLAKLTGGETDDIAPAGAPEELTDRLLRAAGASVSGVDIDAPEPEADGLDPEAFTARIELASPAGARHVTVPFGLGLAMAAVAGAPVRVPGAVLDRLAVAVPGDDLLSPFLGRVPPVARPAGGRLAEAGSPARQAAALRTAQPAVRRRSGPVGTRRQLPTRQRRHPAAGLLGRHRRPVRGPVVGGRPASRVGCPGADDLRGRLLRRHGRLRRRDPHPAAHLRGRDPAGDPQGTPERAGRPRCHHLRRPYWTRHEIAAAVPEDAELIRFGITLAGPGQVALRHAELTRRA